MCQAPVVESIQIKRHLRLVSNVPSRALGMLAWSLGLDIRVIGGVRRPEYRVLLSCSAAQRGAICLPHVLQFRVLLTLIIAFLLSRKRSPSCFLQKPGMMSRAQEGKHQTLKNNFARSVYSLHPRMRRLRDNA